MRTYRFLFCLLLGSLLVAGQATALTGKQIMEEQNQRHNAAQETMEQVMVLVDKKGNKENRALRWYTKELSGQESRYLIVFDSPAAIKGTALLTWDHASKASDQWLYLPAGKRVQRIASGSKKGYFAGTDFTYEDLEPVDLDDFTFKILREEKIDKKDCWVIEAEPANKTAAKESSYGRRLFWVRQDIYLTIKIEFYDQATKLIKTQTAYEFVQIKGTMWRSSKVLMDNHKMQHKTLMAVKSRELDQKIDNKLFTEAYLLAERHLK